MDLFTIVSTALSTEYKLGTNDCNLMCLQVLDLRSGTDYSQIAKYKTIKAGVKQLQSLGSQEHQCCPGWRVVHHQLSNT